MSIIPNPVEIPEGFEPLVPSAPKGVMFERLPPYIKEKPYSLACATWEWPAKEPPRAGDSICFEEARDGTLIHLLVRDGRIINAGPSEWPAD